MKADKNFSAFKAPALPFWTVKRLCFFSSHFKLGNFPRRQNLVYGLG